MGTLTATRTRGRKRRVKAPKPKRSWVEPEQLPALLEAADVWHRPVIATLAGGPRHKHRIVGLASRTPGLPLGQLVHEPTG
jgi:hypothetical protein